MKTHRSPIFRNAGEPAATRNAMRERLLDILELFEKTDAPTLTTLMQVKKCSERHAERRIHDLIGLSKTLGFQMSRAPAGRIAEDEDDPEFSGDTRWVVAVDDLRGLLKAVERELERMEREDRVTARESGAAARAAVALGGDLPKGVRKRDVLRGQEKIEAAEQRRAELAEAGVCITLGCGQAAEDETLKCRRCRVADASATIRRRQRLIDLGLCVDCGLRQPIKDSPVCGECGLSRREYLRSYRMALKEAGLCGRCGKAPRQDGASMCAECAKISRLKDSQPDQKASRQVRLKKLRDERRAAGLCTTCGEEAVQGKTLCEKHLAYYRDRQADAMKKRRSSGLCSACTRQAVPGKSMCKEHLATHRAKAEAGRPAAAEKMRVLRLQRKQAGLCDRCGLPVVPGRSKCVEHLRYSADKQREYKRGKAPDNPPS